MPPLVGLTSWLDGPQSVAPFSLPAPSPQKAAPLGLPPKSPPDSLAHSVAGLGVSPATLVPGIKIRTQTNPNQAEAAKHTHKGAAQTGPPPLFKGKVSDKTQGVVSPGIPPKQ